LKEYRSQSRRDVNGQQSQAQRGSSATQIAFVIFAVVLGGSSVATTTYLLYAVSALLIIFLLLRFSWSARISNEPLLQSVCLGYLALVLLHLIPLPPAAWASLPGRETILAGYSLAGEPAPWLPISLDPAGTAGSVFGILPLLCVILLAGRTAQPPAHQVSVAILLLGLVSLLLGFAQAQGGQQPYLFLQEPNFGTASGFFANPNHFATLLLICVPLFAAAFRHLSEDRPTIARFRFLALAAFCLFVGGGILLTDSLAGLLLLVPTTIASYALLRPNARWVIALGALGCVTAALFMVTVDWQQVAASRTSFGNDQLDRGGIALTGRNAAEANFPVGTGLGTFRYAYRLFEDPAEVERSYINRAHNEYLDVALEAGLPGMILLALFVLWWAMKAFTLWRPRAPEKIWHRAASVVIGIVLLHSLVDYPARMPAILVIFTFFVLVLVDPGLPESGRLRHLEAVAAKRGWMSRGWLRSVTGRS